MQIAAAKCRKEKAMNRLAIVTALGLALGCHYNEYVNKETGYTAAKDIPTQRTAAPQGQLTEETSNAQTLPDTAR